MKISLIVEIASICASLLFYAVMLFTQKARKNKILEQENAAKDFSYSDPEKKRRILVFTLIPLFLFAAFLVNYNAYFVVLASALCALATYIVCKEECDNLRSALKKNDGAE